jgi:hypothetical protein
MQMIIGQILGILSTIIGVCSFQVNNKKQLLLIQSVSTILTCISYLFLGATSGFALNIVCLARNIVFCFSKKGRKLEYILTGTFMLLMGFIGALSWQGPISLLMIVALTVNTLFLYFPNVQNLRKSILVTSTLVIIYNAYFSVWGGVANEVIAISSSIIGIYRYRTKSKD